jgi:hypothetical protein
MKKPRWIRGIDGNWREVEYKWKVELHEPFTIAGRKKPHGEQSFYTVLPKTEYFETREAAFDYYNSLKKKGANLKNWIYHVKKLQNKETAKRRAREASKKEQIIVNLPDILRDSSGAAA